MTHRTTILPVALDIDGVLLDAIGAAHGWLAKKLGVAPQEIRRTGIWSRPFEADLPIDRRILQGMWAQEEVICNMQPLPYALELCRSLAGQDRLTSYITRRNPSVSRFTYVSLLMHGFPYAPIHHIGGLECAGGNDICKTVFASRYRAGVLVDDNVDEAARALSNGYDVVMPTQPWNEGWVPVAHVERFHRAETPRKLLRLLGAGT